jgi:dienelactone hydrolase
VADVVLFHSAVGLRPAVERAAEGLRAHGHTVTTPDLYDGETFTDVDEGVAHMQSISWPELLRRATAAVEGLPADLVYMGMSMGAGLAATLAAAREGARGVVLLYGPEVPEDPWPAGVPVQAHHAAQDRWVDPGSETALISAVTTAGGQVSIHVYPGTGHLLDDDDLPDQFDPVAAPVVWQRVAEFLTAL